MVPWLGLSRFTSTPRRQTINPIYTLHSGAHPLLVGWKGLRSPFVQGSPIYYGVRGAGYEQEIWGWGHSTSTLLAQLWIHTGDRTNLINL